MVYWLLDSEVSIHRGSMLDQGSLHDGRQEAEREEGMGWGLGKDIQEGAKEERREREGGRVSALSLWTA